nr:TonB-dependent receptor [Gammaproteobacteria bacterium]
NRLFEQEFFDVERVEVLRGPQGTLFGRNATGGVVDMLPRMPEAEFGANIKAEVGNYNSRRTSGSLNVPLGETFAMRFSGAMTQRDGFDTNTFTGNDVNDRDLYSTRMILQWQPNDNFNANLIWQHFKEDDQRSRTGKQLCTRDPGRAKIGNTEVPEGLRGTFSQGCLPSSIYDDEAYGTPNAQSYAYVLHPSALAPVGFLDQSTFNPAFIIDRGVDPYASVQQSRDLHELATSYDPVFRAENDLIQLNFDFGLGEQLQFYSQTTHAKDDYYSSQDYNRYVSDSVFNDTANFWSNIGIGVFEKHPTGGPAPGGFYTDPQLGPSNGILAVDISKSKSKQWSQEFRLQSDFDGPFNFLVGANYLDFETVDEYYVFNNMFSFISEYFYNRRKSINETTGHIGTRNCEGLNGDGSIDAAECLWVDYSSLEDVNGEGHNYFLSRNPVQTRSQALFGETYWQLSDNVKLTGGLRYTKDRKNSTPVPSQLLMTQTFSFPSVTNPDGKIDSGLSSGGRSWRGHPEGAEVKQEWGEFTGRLVLDWQTQTPFTDETLVYFSVARGYKAGGTNPPRMDIDPEKVQYQPLADAFDPEFVNAFEIGTKNSLLDGAITLNANAFYYDYKDYQVSQITDRISLNETFDAEIWGLELEAAWQVAPNTQLDMNLGYLRTRIGDGEKSIDVMDRTQGNADWVQMRPWIQLPSNCIAPVSVVEDILNSPQVTQPGAQGLPIPLIMQLCGGAERYGTFDGKYAGDFIAKDLAFVFGLDEYYNPLKDAPNGGRGFFADLGGNELPNSPNFTMNLGIQHIFQLNDWELKLRADYYRQSDSYARVYNSEYDKLEGWDNFNAAMTLSHPASALDIQFYVKNIFDDAPITDFFTNSDDTGLSTNVFTLEPRIVGLSVYKQF